MSWVDAFLFGPPLLVGAGAWVAYGLFLRSDRRVMAEVHARETLQTIHRDIHDEATSP